MWKTASELQGVEFLAATGGDMRASADHLAGPLDRLDDPSPFPPHEPIGDDNILVEVDYPP